MPGMLFRLILLFEFIFSTLQGFTQDTIRIMEGQKDFYIWDKGIPILKDTAVFAHYMIYSRYSAADLYKEFDVYNKKLNGIEISYNYPAKTPYSIISWKNGLMDGSMRIFHSDTILDIACEFKEGWPNGEYSAYIQSADSVLLWKHGYFKNGFRDSIWTEYFDIRKGNNYEQVKEYTFKNGETAIISSRYIDSMFTLINGNGFISTQVYDTTFYSGGRKTKTVQYRDAYNYNSQYKKMLASSEIFDSMGGTRQIIYFDHMNYYSSSLPYYQSSYKCLSTCIDTVTVQIEMKYIRCKELKKTCLMVPNGKFISYTESPDMRSYYSSSFRTLSNKSVYENGNLVDTAYWYDEKANLMAVININKDLEEHYKNGKPIHEKGIFLATADKTFYLHLSGNEKTITLRNDLHDNSDPLIIFDQNGACWLVSDACRQRSAGTYSIEINRFTVSKLVLFGNHDRKKYDFYKPVHISKKKIVLKGEKRHKNQFWENLFQN